MKIAAIPEATRATVLEAAWQMIAETGRADFPLTALAARAGVSRQTVYLAFGQRAGLLTAMLRHHDAGSPHIARMLALRQEGLRDGTALLAFLEAWMDYLPDIYPVAIQMSAAAVSDPDARQAWDDRMVHALRAGLRRTLTDVAAAGQLREGLEPEKAADVIWSLVHLDSWHLLVVTCGWSPEAFRADRLRLARSFLREGNGG